MKMFMVGGAVRDEILGVKSKDIDFSVVLDQSPVWIGIDPFDGRQDISHRIIRAVGDPVERLREDALRAVRAIRFAVTKDFTIDSDLKNAMETREVELALMSNISDERISDELSKMFRFNTLASLRILDEFIGLRRAIFHSG